MRINYVLTINVPDEIDADTLAEIEESAEPHDKDMEAKIRRWLGGRFSHAEDALYDSIPFEWDVSISEVRSRVLR